MPNNSQPPISSTTSLSDKYVERQTARLLRTYTDEPHSRIQPNYNENIDTVFYSKSEWTQLLKDENNYLEKKWRTKLLMETTPRGNIVMYYDAYKLGFSYYADQTVPYSVLNAVSMKYVLTFFCRDFFMDETVLSESNISGITIKHKEYDDAERKAKAESEPSNTKSWRFPKNNGPVNDGIDSKSPFVKFKSYNNISAKSTNASNKINKSATENDQPTLTEPKQTNRFICLGKIRNVSFLQACEMNKRIESSSNTSERSSDNILNDVYVQKVDSESLSQSGVYSIFAPSSTVNVNNHDFDTYVSIKDSIENISSVSEANTDELRENDTKISISSPVSLSLSLPDFVAPTSPIPKTTVAKPKKQNPIQKPKITYAEYKRLREVLRTP